MRVLLRSLIAFTLGVSLFAQTSPPPYKRADLPVDVRVRDLLSRMTLEEKFWQLFMIPGDLDTPSNDYSKGIFGLQIRAGKDGAAPRGHAERINAIQKYFVEQTWEYPVVGGVVGPQGLPPLAELEGPEIDLTDLDSLAETQALLGELGLDVS